jgi:hypothetical protein
MTDGFIETTESENALSFIVFISRIMHRVSMDNRMPEKEVATGIADEIKRLDRFGPVTPDESRVCDFMEKLRN